MDLSCTLAVPRRNIGDFDVSGAGIERDWVARTACWASAERVKRDELHLMQHCSEWRNWRSGRSEQQAVEGDPRLDLALTCTLSR